MDLRGFRLFLTVAVALAFAESIGGVYSYTRPPMHKNLVDRHLDEEPTPIDDYAPQQVSISFIYIYLETLVFSMNLFLKIVETKFCASCFINKTIL